MNLIGSLAAMAAMLPVLPAYAEPVNTGWDNEPDVVLGGGSDTTYLVNQRLGSLYNAAPGCTITTTTSGDLNKGSCVAGTTGVTNGNYDHDIFSEATPTGSSAGVNAILPTGTPYVPAIDYARSSRGPSGTETESVTFWGFARDGIAVTTFGTRTGVSLTKQDLKDIYQCTKTNWSDFGQPAAPIIPWDMNSASGTAASFRTYLDNITYGACVRKLTSGVSPFENDVKPILADAGPDLILGNADDDENNYIWWMSFGNWLTYPYTKNGCANGQGTLNATTGVQNCTVAAVNSNLVSVAGAIPSEGNIFDGSYAITRTLYHVTREADADCNQVPGTDTSVGVVECNNVGAEVYGADTGKNGAVREFTEWLCRTSNNQHAISTVSGKGLRTEIVAALNAEGFQQVSPGSGLRTAGYACQVLN
jgi:ABC-type phosphate transport system substrate-binding protein